MTFKKGYKMSDETKKKLFTKERNLKVSNSLKGRIFSVEHCKNISESKKGQIAWNKGLKGSDKLWKNGHPRGMLNKHHSEISRRKISESNKGKPPVRGMLGKHLSVESRHRLSVSKKGAK
jgi:hypothetical protein